MSKVKQIIIREYITRVRKKAFLIMTLLGPVLFAAMMIIPVWLTRLEDQETKKIAIVEYDHYGQPVPDSLMLFKDVFKEKDLLKFDYMGGLSEAQVEALAQESDYFGFLKIKHNILLSAEDVTVEMIAKEHPSMGLELQLSNDLEKKLQDEKLLTYRVPKSVLKSLNSNVKIHTRKVEKDGFTEGNTDVKRIIGYVSGLLIYMFIFFFGAQVMRGVVEEKTNRIIEVIITSVKPFQLMLGKIVGIALVGLTQFMAWIILTIAIYQVGSTFFLKQELATQQQEQAAPTELFESNNTKADAFEAPVASDESSFGKIREMVFQENIPYLLALFLFYFIGGYLLYAAMFAAIGSAVDSETDTQQFMMPVTIPLIISILAMSSAITNPSGPVAFWFSMIPFTSPVIMMVRAPFHVPPLQIAASMAILIASFVFMTWLSGKIYRTGILIYGKKVNFKEIIKWMRYK